ncbi:MAG: cysteine--tRNA ligase, partial [bacterium]|nr:cysteine--tRNA ligase [bacterium]
MALKLYNTLSRKKEVFRPRRSKEVNLFVCGPTVYDFSHIGHARTYIVFDVITKYLREKGFDVFYLQNITDIDDKIIKRAKEKKNSPQKLARDFEKEYLKDMKSLKIDSVTKYARATEHIKEIQSQVKRLLEKGFAYQIEDGIYYDISKFKDYGKLSRRTVLQAEDGVSRIDTAEEKRNKGDFCLWKFSKPGEPKWPSPWQNGRPGWHIEDTAIAEKYFGFQYDIHGGAKDLIFPHHEAEISQMEAISKRKPMVKYWIHSGFLTVNGQKMAKSLGNFITIREFLKKNSPRVLRFFVIKTLYHSPIDYREGAILQAKRELEKIDEFIEKLNMIKSQKENKKRFAKSLVLRTEKEFRKAMDDDFNTPKALAS